ncbi:MAG: hypothetical protein LC794_03195 [Acidobacteria bacterium]|nr:hypothetical protein [Acidobacteriota bacterium]
MPGIEIEIPREAIEQITREVLESMLGNAAAIIHDEEAQTIERTLQRIKAKQFITIPEFALLFNCSRCHVDKLLDQAQQPNCKYPVPYVDLNGLIQFDRLEVLEWARLRKPFDRKRRKTGGKKKRYPVAVNQ